MTLLGVLLCMHSYVRFGHAVTLLGVLLYMHSYVRLVML